MDQPSCQVKAAKLVRRGKWVTLLAWVIVLVFTFPFINKLSNSLNNTNKLSNNVQSQKVANIEQKANPNASEEDLEVVYQNKVELSAQDKQTIAEQRSQIIAANVKNVTGVSPVTYSADRQAAYFTLLANVPNNQQAGPTIEKNIVTKVRDIAKSSGDLTASTTGAIAVDVDSNTANADTILLVSAAVIVIVLMLLTYRSALLWIIPPVSAVMAISLADAIVYAFTRHGMQVTSMDSSILIVLVFGVATDYGMLLISRYREYLHTHADKNDAVALALKGSIEAISASAATVALALLALVFAIFSATKDLGPVAAIGIACAFLVQVTFLPAMLAIGGRILLWPKAPMFVPGTETKDFAGSHLWAKIASVISRHPRRITAGTTVVLLICALGLAQLTLTVNFTAVLRGNPPSVQGLNTLERHFAEISSAPLVITANSVRSIQQAKQIAQQSPGTGQVSSVTPLAGYQSISIEPKANPYSNVAFSYISNLRTRYQQAGLSEVNVGGNQAIAYDYNKIARRDDKVLMPIILAIVAIILGLLLRSIIAPIMLLITVIISFAGSFGISVFIFQHLFHFQGLDPALPLYIFLFVVALGIDYNIFLMSPFHISASYCYANLLSFAA